jgi:hypothetical protein
MSNVDGTSNNAIGYNALQHNNGLENNAMGVLALQQNTSGAANVVVGDSAFINSTTGSYNTIIGWQAGTGSGVDGDDDIYIGATSGLPGGGAETGYIRIGDPGFITTCYIAGITGVSSKGGVPVCVDSEGQLAECDGAASPGSTKEPRSKESLKHRQAMQQLKAASEKQAAKIAAQERQIQTLTAALKQQAEQIQKVSAQLEMVRPAPRVVNTH